MMKNLKIFNYININIVILIFILGSCNEKVNLKKEVTVIQKKSDAVFDSIQILMPKLNEIKYKLNLNKDRISDKDSLTGIKYLGLISDIENIESDLNEWEKDEIKIKNNIQPDEQYLNLSKKSFNEISKIKFEISDIDIRSGKLLNSSVPHK